MKTSVLLKLASATAWRDMMENLSFFGVVKYLEAIERELQSPPHYPHFSICFADSTVNILNCFPSRLGTLVEAYRKAQLSSNGNVL